MRVADVAERLAPGDGLMRIIQAVGWYFPERLGGTEVYVAALAERLRRLDHDVRIVAPELGASAPRRYDHAGIQVFRFPIRTPLTRDQAQGRATVDGSYATKDGLV